MREVAAEGGEVQLSRPTLMEVMRPLVGEMVISASGRIRRVAASGVSMRVPWMMEGEVGGEELRRG